MISITGPENNRNLSRADSRLDELTSPFLAMKTVTTACKVLISASRSAHACCLSRDRRTLVMTNAEKEENITSVFSCSADG